MNINNFCERNPLSDSEWSRYKEKTTTELNQYFNFLLSLTDRDDIHEKMQKNFDSLECFILDSKRTLIPRIFNGKDGSFRLPHRAVAFTYKQESIGDPANKDDKITQGLAFRIDDPNKGVKFHEMNHSISNENSFKQVDRHIYKYGLRLEYYKEKDDSMYNLTGNLINEGVTDAISKYYYDKQNYTDESGKCIPYTTSYDGINKAMSIMLGKDLSNKLLLNAYFGSMKDFDIFAKHFKDLMWKDDITFMTISKLDFSYSNTEDDVYFSDEELLLIACKYRINLAESINNLEDEYNFIKGFELNKDIKEKLTKLFHEKQAAILNKTNNEEKE